MTLKIQWWITTLESVSLINFTIQFRFQIIISLYNVNISGIVASVITHGGVYLETKYGILDQWITLTLEDTFGSDWVSVFK